MHPNQHPFQMERAAQTPPRAWVIHFHACNHPCHHFADLDYGLAWNRLLQEIIQKPRLVVGAIAFILMIPLAITSFDIWKKRLGKNWKRLHQTVYFLAPLVALPYVWSKKRRYPFFAE
jgi:sulfoxide reductase heme-binding subunit YedZ